MPGHELVNVYDELLSFQEVQHLNPLDASIRFLPDLLFGVFLNIMTGLLVHKLPVMPLATTAAVFSAMSPLIMAVIDPTKSYWLAEFWAMLLLPSSADSKLLLHHPNT